MSPVGRSYKMPLFGSQRKHSNERRRSRNMAGESGSTPTLPPPPEPQGRAPPQSMIPSRQELLFHCQLAHGSATREIKDFSNVKELYSRIADCFSIAATDVSPMTSFYPSNIILISVHFGVYHFHSYRMRVIHVCMQESGQVWLAKLGHS